MTIDETTRLSPLAGVGGPAAAPSANAPPDSADFRRLLESFERLAREHRAAPAPADAGDVEDAVARADEGFSLAMDLRRQLESAFRERMP